MLYPYSRAWTSTQKRLLAAAGAFGVVLVAALVLGYEMHLRNVIKNTLIDHQWTSQGCIDCSTDITFRANHTIEVEEDAIGGPYRGTGTWQLRGRDYIVLDYATRSVGWEGSDFSHYHTSLHIDKLTPEELLADNMLYQVVYKRTK
jgi:hypothetical protein